MGNSSWSNDQINTLVIVEGNPYTGLFFYSPTAGTGNLIGSWTAQAGTDPYGNAYPAGFSIVGSPGSGTVTISPYTGAVGESPVLQFASGQNIASQFGTIRESTVIGNTAEVLVRTGPALTADATTQYIEDAFFSYNTSGPVSAVYDLWFVESGTRYNLIFGGAEGLSILGNITPQQPGATIPTRETWHTATPATGWTFTGVTAPDMSYKLTANNTVRIEGNIKYATGTPASGSTMFTLPAAYAPPTLKYYLTPTGGFAFLVEVSTTGAVIIQNWSGQTLGATPQVYISMEFPLDL